MISLAPTCFFRSAPVCCPRTDSALMRMPCATHATCHPRVCRTALAIVTFAPGLSTEASGGRNASVSRVDPVVVELVVAGVVADAVAVVPEDECVPPQPAAARTHTVARIPTRDRDQILCTPLTQPGRVNARMESWPTCVVPALAPSSTFQATYSLPLAV
jgi:hypothetical protein